MWEYIQLPIPSICLINCCDQILFFEIGKSGVDEQNVIIFKYNEGMLAQQVLSVLLDTGDDAEIIGENGRIVVPKF